MLDSRALLIAAATAAGFAGVTGEAHALTPMSMDMDMAVDPSVNEGPSAYATMAPREFAPLPDEAYEPTARITNRRARLQCVPFARRESGVELYGNANTWWAQAQNRYETTQEPEEKTVMVLEGYNTTARGHVAVVREIVSPRLIVVDHANWLNGGEITRDVPIRDVSDDGDWSEVQVWNVQGRHWGGRTYQVQGFILNILAEAAGDPPPPTNQSIADVRDVPLS
jgi:surface antigen